MGKEETAKELKKELDGCRQEVEHLHASAMELAIGMSECFEVLEEVRKGNLEARISEDILNSSEELIAKLGEILNETIAEQQELVNRQQFAIQELSTPVLQLWGNILVLPIIGVVDTKRAMEITERLLSEIVARQARFVIMDITGVDIVDTKTADHLIKVIKAAGLLGTTCIMTGIQPAVAQTLVEIGMDLTSITTLRDLSEGLKECLRLMELRDVTVEPLSSHTRVLDVGNTKNSNS